MMLLGTLCFIAGVLFTLIAVIAVFGPILKSRRPFLSRDEMAGDLSDTAGISELFHGGVR